MKQIYIKTFEARHNLFDTRFLSEFGDNVKVIEPLSSYSLSCLRALLLTWLNQKDTVILSVVSNWMLYVLPKRGNIRFIVHNNLDRRFSRILFRVQSQLVTTSDYQNRILPNANYIGHPIGLPKYGERIRKVVGALVITDDLNVMQFVLDNITKDIVVKGDIGLARIDNFDEVLSKSEFLIIDKSYSTRASSVVAMGLAEGCRILVTQEKTCLNLNSTFGVSCIKILEDWAVSTALYASERVELQENFGSKVRNIE